MINNKYFPTLVCGFSAAVLSIVPGIRNFSCCMIVPGAAAISIMLYRKIHPSNERISLGESLGFGFLTGLSATFFLTALDVILTYFTRSNDFVENLPEIELTVQQLNLGPVIDESLRLIKSTANQIEKNGFSIVYLLLMLSGNFIINSIFGMIGGTLGMSLINKKLQEGQ